MSGETLDIGAASTDYHGLPSLSGSIQDSMDARFQRIEQAAANGSDLQAMKESLAVNFERINGYLLQLEINAGIDSPAGYAKERMALQIGRLSTAMGKNADQELLDNQSLVNRIHTTGAVSAEKQMEIDQRFQQGYGKLHSSEQ